MAVASGRSRDAKSRFPVGLGASYTFPRVLFPTLKKEGAQLSTVPLENFFHVFDYCLQLFVTPSSCLLRCAAKSIQLEMKLHHPCTQQPVKR